MNTFFDSSAFAKRYVLEEGSQIVEDICIETSSLGLSIICVPELISAFNRKIREKSLTPDDYYTVKTRLIEEIEDAIILNITPSVVNTSITLLESNNLRAMDSLHIACAIEWHAELFVSSDYRQIEAAQNAGLTVRFV
ncbi:type II toxin-antitoxin system VapC family toxin [bacterium]|nr:type II toxin-antitoxin system VapC family toxin [bacterium]